MPLEPIKVLIAERNGQELENEEYDLKAETVPFSAPGTHLEDVDNVKAAILRAGRYGANISWPGAGEWSQTDTWTRVGSIIYRGSLLQSAPTYARGIIYTDATSGGVRVFDATNNLEICSVTGITATSPTLVNLSAPANIPTGEAILEIQINRIGSGTKKTWIQAFQMGS